MATVTRDDDREDSMADRGELPDEADRDERPDAPAPAADQGGAVAVRTADRGAGFFTIHKPGQGYWTRVGTVAGLGLIALLAAGFLFQHLKVWLPANQAGQPRVGLVIGIIVALLAAFSFYAFRVLNRPRVVDFLIATESEMKKVNWTSRKELIGSTKVVIVFMFLIAAILFVIDLLFHTVFYWIGVLKVAPFFLKG